MQFSVVFSILTFDRLVEPKSDRMPYTWENVIEKLRKRLKHADMHINFWAKPSDVRLRGMSIQLSASCAIVKRGCIFRCGIL